MDINGVVFSQSFDNIEKAIKMASNRQKVIASNIANIESGNFKKLSFDDELAKAQARIASKEILLDNEMAKLSENNIRMSSYAQLLSSKLKMLKKVVTLGKG